MFGNPLVSNTPVDDIYATQADTQANGFASPMNYANQNQGWNIDPSLLSPSYTAGYRPQYGGPSGANEFGHPGFFRGLWNLNPLAKDVGWGNPVMHQQSSIEDVTNRPVDATMWGFQRLAMPVIGYGVGNRVMSAMGIGWKTGAKFGSGLGGGMARSFGMASPGLRATAAGIKAGYTANGLAGAANAMKGVGLRGAVGLGARAGMAAGFGLAAGVAVPLMAGQALITAGEKGIVDPYINTRSSAHDLRSNFAGITFNESEGNMVTGKGLSFSESTDMAKHITSAGIDDMHFENDEYRQGADMIGRTGLLDSVNSGQLVQRIKEDMKQVKLIMGIANMPEIKEAVEQLAKLQMAGANTSGGLMSNAATAMGNIGRHAAMAGTTAQRLMNTVGAQGQYLYQANGMTPYLGQLAAGASYSALSAAQRMGVLSPEQMARMGGLEGATQASLTGQLNASQTLYNKLAMFNSYLGGQAGTAAGFGKNQDAISVIQKFGGTMANDPLGVYGAMSYYGRQMAGKQLEERGSLAIEDQVMSRVPKFLLDDNGKLSAERAVPFLKQMNLSDDEIQGFFAQRMSETDDGAYETRKRALSANSAERVRQYISDTGTYGGVIGTGIYKTKKFGRELTKSVKGLTVDPLLTFTSNMGDAGQNFTDWVWYGGTVGNNRNEEVEDLLGNKDAIKQSKMFKPDNSLHFGLPTKENVYKLKQDTVANDINQLIVEGKAGASTAQEYMNAKDQATRRKALEKLIKSGNLKSGAWVNYQEDFKDTNDFIDLDKSLSSRQTFDTNKVAKNNSGKEFEDELTRVDGLQAQKKFDALQDIGNAVAIATDPNITSGTADELLKTDKRLQQFAKRRRITGGAEALAAAKQVAIRARETGLDTMATVASTLDAGKFKNDEDGVREAFKIAGGAHLNATKNASKLSQDEALGLSAEVRQDALERNKIYQLHKEGRIDFQTMRQITSQLDMGKSVEKFGKAVDEFVKGVAGSAKPDNVTQPGFFERVLTPLGYRDRLNNQNETTKR